MKITETIKRKTIKKEWEVPEGDYCQREDGSVSCKYYGYSADILCGAQFYCNAFGDYFDVPYDNKYLDAYRDIKKCEKCLRLTREQERKSKSIWKRIFCKGKKKSNENN